MEITFIYHVAISEVDFNATQHIPSRQTTLIQLSPHDPNQVVEQEYKLPKLLLGDRIAEFKNLTSKVYMEPHKQIADTVYKNICAKFGL